MGAAFPDPEPCACRVVGADFHAGPGSAFDAGGHGVALHRVSRQRVVGGACVVLGSRAGRIAGIYDRPGGGGVGHRGALSCFPGEIDTPRGGLAGHCLALLHRGGDGSDPVFGDGAGFLCLFRVAGYALRRLARPAGGFPDEPGGFRVFALGYIRGGDRGSDPAVVAGDVQPGEVRKLAETYYGAIPANPELPERSRAKEPRQMAERRLAYEDSRVAQPYVTRSYLAPERDSGAQEKAAALTLLADILGGGSTSVMAEKLQFDDQIAVHTSAYYRGKSLDQTTLNFYVVPAPGVTLDQAEDGLDRVLTEFLETGVDRAQLDRIKMQVKASQIYARDDVNALANRYGRALTQGLTVEDVQAWPEILQAVTPEDIMAAAHDVLDRKNSVTGRLMAPEVTQ